MLILSRRPGELIRIGGQVTVKVLTIRGGQVRLGVAAPKVVPVDREEIHQRKKRAEPTSGEQGSQSSRDVNPNARAATKAGYDHRQKQDPNSVEV